VEQFQIDWFFFLLVVLGFPWYFIATGRVFTLSPFDASLSITPMETSSFPTFSVVISVGSCAGPLLFAPILPRFPPDPLFEAWFSQTNDVLVLHWIFSARRFTAFIANFSPWAGSSFLVAHSGPLFRVFF